MMKIKRISYAVFMLLPLLVTGITLFFLPDVIPTHYGANGVADGWGSKFEMLVLPLLNIGFGLFLLLVAKLSGKVEEENKNNEKITMTIGLVMMAVFGFMNYYFLYAALSGAVNLYKLPLDIFRLVGVLFGAAFIAIGNIMPKTRKNSVVGFRTAWTMKNEITWKKCQLFGGVSFIIAGFVIALGSLFIFKGLSCIFYLLGVLALTVAADVVYSYFIMKKYGKFSDASTDE